MDDHQPPDRAETPIFRRIPPDLLPAEELPPGFLPIRLWMNPGNVCIELTRPDMILGRHSSADLRVPLPDISRRHCRFVFEEGIWKIFDLNSLNGIYINGERVQLSALKDGDEIGLCTIKFVVMVISQPDQNLHSARDSHHSENVLKAIVDRIPFANPEEPEDYRKAS